MHRHDWHNHCLTQSFAAGCATNEAWLSRVLEWQRPNATECVFGRSTRCACKMCRACSYPSCLLIP
eukprot:222123-Chlamydomonas_euryale.AAC.3